MNQQSMFPEAEQPKTGTREWSVASVNIARGCSHLCSYCWARANALRFKQIATPEEWGTEVVRRNPTKERKFYPGGMVMFPTTHDLTPALVEPALEALHNLLGAGNQVLIVSKPHYDVIARLTGERWFYEYLDHVLFRFSIGTLNDELAQRWEPGAPLPSERFLALGLAVMRGFQTSVSMEPALDTATTAQDFETMAPHVTETIWVGKLNRVRVRVRGMAEADVAALEAGQTDERILALYEQLQGESKVRWKDSIRQVLERHGVL